MKFISHFIKFRAMTYFSLSLSKKYNSLFLFAFTCLLFFSGCKDDAMDPNIFVKSLGGTQEFTAMDKNSFVQLATGMASMTHWSIKGFESIFFVEMSCSFHARNGFEVAGFIT